MMFLTIPIDNDVAITFGYTVFLFKLLHVKIFIVMDIVLFYFYYAFYFIVIKILALIRSNERINSHIKDSKTGSFEPPIKQKEKRVCVQYNCFTPTINIIILKLNWN